MKGISAFRLHITCEAKEAIKIGIEFPISNEENAEKENVNNGKENRTICRR